MVLYAGRIVIMVDVESLKKCETLVKYKFNDYTLLAAALTHSSAAAHHLHNYERLEFLGDAVLGLIVCGHVYTIYPDRREGDLTVIKAAAVSRRSCARISDEIGLSALVRVGAGMNRAGGLPMSVAAGLLEAVIGAIYVDSGGNLAPVRDFVLPLIEKHLEEIIRNQHDQNYKSILQQHAQREFNSTPVYHVLAEAGLDHDKSFQVYVTIGDQRFEPQWGGSKKIAEQAAARCALERLGVELANIR